MVLAITFKVMKRQCIWNARGICTLSEGWLATFVTWCSELSVSEDNQSPSENSLQPEGLWSAIVVHSLDKRPQVLAT